MTSAPTLPTLLRPGRTMCPRSAYAALPVVLCVDPQHFLGFSKVPLRSSRAVEVDQTKISYALASPFPLQIASTGALTSTPRAFP